VTPVDELPRTWGALLGDLARSRPHHCAVVAEDASLTFAEMNASARRVAKSMLALGLRRGDVVALLDGNTSMWIQAFCGAANIGVVCTPVNTWYQRRELVDQLRHSKAAAILAVPTLLRHDYGADLFGAIPTLADAEGRPLHDAALPTLRHVVSLPGAGHICGSIGWDTFLAMGEEISEAELDRAEAEVDIDDVLHILYTSGSTSRPKGVQATHRNSIRNAFCVGERIHLDGDDRFWHSGPLFYGLATVLTLPATWTHGATYLLQKTFSAEGALTLIQREAATAFAGYGNVTRALLQHAAFADTDVSSLRKGATGFTREDKRLAAIDLGARDVVSIYGLTETHGPCATSEAGDPLDTFLDTQGLLIPGWEARVVDPGTDTTVPDGQPGELLVRGRMMPGYLDDPDADASVFTDDGFFRTGDLVKFDLTGRLRFQARAKEVLKVGGINISPTEVEDLLDEHPDVRQAHVVGVPHPAKGELLVAFVEAAHANLTEGELREFVSDRAAKFKVPAHILFRTEDQLPRVASGKMPRYVLAQEAQKELGLL